MLNETHLRTLRTGMVMLWPLTQTLRFLRFHRIACGQQAGPFMDKAPSMAHHVVEECVVHQNCQTLESVGNQAILKNFKARIVTI